MSKGSASGTVCSQCHSHCRAPGLLDDKSPATLQANKNKPSLCGLASATDSEIVAQGNVSEVNAPVQKVLMIVWTR